MRIGLIDVDGHNYPNLALMKISAYHKALGDIVEWWWGWDHYDRVYMSKVFDDTYTPDMPEPVNADEIIKGGTGYVLRDKDNTLKIFHDGKWTEVFETKQMMQGNVRYNEFLPYDAEHCCPDYSIYPKLTKDTAYGFLTRGCPNNCPFCIVCAKEGRKSYKVADLSEWWHGQKNIVLMDPNLLACRDHMDLLRQLHESKASIDINQGLDARLLTEDNIHAINKLRLKEIHFAWDLMKNEKAILEGLNLYKSLATRKLRGMWGSVYVLTNFDTTMEENLYRVYKLRDMGFDPYVMVYDKPNAPQEVKHLQRWVNNKWIFKSTKTFEEYDPKRR